MSDIERSPTEYLVRDDLAQVCLLFGHTKDAAEWVAGTFAPLAGRILARKVQDEIEHMEARAA